MRKHPTKPCLNCGTTKDARSKYCRACWFKLVRTIPLEIRFWKKVKKTKKCWLWIGSTYKYGYGNFFIKWRKPPLSHILDGAHRVSWKIHFGKIPRNLCVLHKCDNPPCVRPSHLWLGTKKDNAIDRAKKGRGYHQKCHTRIA